MRRAQRGLDRLRRVASGKEEAKATVALRVGVPAFLPWGLLMTRHRTFSGLPSGVYALGRGLLVNQRPFVG